MTRVDATLVSAASAWIAVLLVVLAAAAGIVFRRLRRAGTLLRRMRPHMALGYAALGFSVLHVSFAMGSMHGADATGLRAASAALVALGVQTFVGASLQDPGSYRRSLRRSHLALFATLAVLLAVHVTANAAFAQ